MQSEIIVELFIDSSLNSQKYSVAYSHTRMLALYLRIPYVIILGIRYTIILPIPYTIKLPIPHTIILHLPYTIILSLPYVIYSAFTLYRHSTLTLYSIPCILHLLCTYCMLTLLRVYIAPTWRILYAYFAYYHQ